MKFLSHLTGIVLILLSTACSTNKTTTRSEVDDRYFSLDDANRERRKLKKLTQEQASNPSPAQNSNSENADGYSNTSSENYQQVPDNSSGSYSSAPSGSGTVTSNYYDQEYDMDNYYDYMYASRIRRFNNNSGNGFGYYNPYYTNMYWYNNDPFMFGNSIYSTYGFYNPYVPWGGPGLNAGWNNHGGFSMNNGFNPYFYSNPWRWNSWGYNPHVSPFSFNPYGYNPYGYGFGSYANGFNNGMAYGLMMNNMYNNPVYYNSFDNNTYNPTVNYGNGEYYGPNTGGSGSGSVMPGSGNLAQVFSNEIGQAAANTDGGKFAPNTNLTSKPVAQFTPAKDQAPIVAANANTTANKAGKASQYSSVLSRETNNNSIKGTSSTQVLQGKAPGNSVSGNSPQSGKQDLISNGVIRNMDAKAPKGDYSSSLNAATVTKASDNAPSTPFARQPNVDPSKISRTAATADVQRPQPVRTPEQLKASGPTPNSGNYSRANNGIKNDPQTPASQQQPVAPRTSQPNNYQQYQQPRTYQQQNPAVEPRNNYQQPTPRQEQRNYNYQQQQAPGEQQRNNNYQQPSQRQQRYEQPAQPSQSPRQSEPRMSNPSRGGESSPRINNRGGNDSSPRMNNGGNDSSPRMNSGSGGGRSGGGGSSSGGRINSPRR